MADTQAVEFECLQGTQNQESRHGETQASPTLNFLVVPFYPLRLIELETRCAVCTCSAMCVWTPLDGFTVLLCSKASRGVDPLESSDALCGKNEQQCLTIVPYALVHLLPSETPFNKIAVQGRPAIQRQDTARVGLDVTLLLLVKPRRWPEEGHVVSTGSNRTSPSYINRSIHAHKLHAPNTLSIFLGHTKLQIFPKQLPTTLM